MKKVVLGLLALSLLAGCSSNPATNSKTGGVAANAATAAKMKFDNEAYDFGKIKQGDKVTHEFKFVNEGKSPLIITDGYASCGCTKPEWPKTPIAPGSSGIVKVTFSSEGKSGLQDKQVTLIANTVPANTAVHLVGEVLEPAKK
jgi:hypothetical protein